MRAFYHPDQARHDPQQFMRFGEVAAPRDLPVRTEKLLEALRRHGIEVERSVEHGIAPALDIHTPSFLAFLETVWERWERLPVRGPEVWPNVFPYWNARPEENARQPCPCSDLLGQVGWYMGDLAVPIGPNTWLSVLRSMETAVTAADAILAGEMSAYSLCRPSGHHARSDRASGFCYLNNTAVATQRLRQKYQRVAVLDVDAHHGDGTQQIFYNRADVLTVSVHVDPSFYYPFYIGYGHETGHGAGEGYNLNLPLAPGSSAKAMSAAVDQGLERIAAFGAQALVVALGYDAHRQDPIGVLKLESEDFGGIAAQVKALGLPTLVVQEGGYGIDIIGDCLDAFIGGLR